MEIMTEFQLIITFQLAHQLASQLQLGPYHTQVQTQNIFVSRVRAQEELLCAEHLTRQGSDALCTVSLCLHNQQGKDWSWKWSLSVEMAELPCTLCSVQLQACHLSTETSVICSNKLKSRHKHTFSVTLKKKRSYMIHFLLKITFLL